MANESTTSTIDDLTNASAIVPSFHDYASAYNVTKPFQKPFDLRGKGSKTVKVPSLTSVLGTLAAGAGVDTEFDATEGTDLSNTARGTGSVTIASTEYGIMMTITDNVLEDNVSGFDIIQELIMDAARVLRTAFEKDSVDLFQSFTTNTAGATTVNLSLANMSTCLVKLRIAGVKAVDNPVFVLDDQAASDYEDALLATGTSWAVYPGTADAYLAVSRDPINGLADGRIGMFRGCAVYQTQLTPTLNTAADVSSGCFVPYTPGNARICALGRTISREFRIETERRPATRGTRVVCTSREAPGELLDAAGVAITSDA